MKRMKKFASLLLALAMVMSCVVVASAATTYKIDSGTLTGGETGNTVAVSLTGLADNAAGGKTIVFTIGTDTVITAAAGTLTGYTIADTTNGGTAYAGADATFSVTPSGASDPVGTITLTTTQEQATAAASAAATITLTLGTATEVAASTPAATTAQPGASENKDNLDSDVQGTANGNGINEGSISDGVFNLTVPTSTNANLYGMILDPHSLLKKTNYARFGANAASVVEFEDEDGHLFFANKVDSGKTTYNSKSASLSITNKSYLPVDVSVEAAITVPDGLTIADKDFTGVDGAGIYLAIESSETYNSASASGASSSPSITSSGTHATPSNLVSTDTDLNNATVTVAQGADTVITVTAPDGYTATAASTNITSTGGFYGGTADTVTVTLKKGNDTAATFTLDVDNHVGAYSETLTLTVPASAGSPAANDPIAVASATKKATLTKTLLGNADKYEEHYKGTAQDITGNVVDLYDYTLKSGATNFPALSFNMTGKINDDSGWDDIKPAAGELKIDLTWKVSKQASGNSGSNGATPPSAEVTSPSTGIAQRAVVSYSLGTGRLAATAVSKVTYVASGASTASEIAAAQIVNDTENHTLTITTIAPVYNGSNWKIVFNDAAATEVAVSLK